MNDSTLELVDRFAGHTATWREAAEDVDQAIADGHLTDAHYAAAATAIRQADPPDVAELLDDECKAALVALCAGVNRLGLMHTQKDKRAVAAFLARAIKGV